MSDINKLNILIITFFSSI